MNHRFDFLKTFFLLAITLCSPDHADRAGRREAQARLFARPTPVDFVDQKNLAARAARAPRTVRHAAAARSARVRTYSELAVASRSGVIAAICW